MAFLTLFLGLITGIHPVELTVVDPDIVRIELHLDGRVIGELRGSPWLLTADFGTRLEPHDLRAIAFDRHDEVIAQSRQWVNMPRDRAEVSFVFEGDQQERVDSARLVWSSVDVAQVDSVEVFLDGVEIEGIDPSGFDLPRYDVNEPHLLRAEVQLGDTSVQTQAVIGGGPGSEAVGGFSAFPLFLEEGKLPTPEELQGSILADGQPIRVVAVERPGADVIMVQDLSWYLQKRLKGVRNDVMKTRISARKRPTGLKYRDHFRILFPIPQAASDAAIQSLHYPISPNLWSGQLVESHSRGAVDRQVADPIPQGLMVGLPVNGERKLDTSNQHLTDAVAVASLTAAQAQRARVLLLVAGSEEIDHSRYSPQQVRHYLDRLGVPLRVWSTEPELVDSSWGQVEDISTKNRLDRAIRDLRSFLDRQIIVWVEGLHLPQQLEVAAESSGRLQRVTAIGAPPTDPDEFEELDRGLMIADHSELETNDQPPPIPPEVAPIADPAATEVADGSTAEQLFVESVDVNVVNVDVVVSSANGFRITDLEKADFRLFEDGKEVEISYFEAPSAQPTTDPTDDSNQATEAVSPTRPMSLIVYLDLVQMTNKQRLRSIQALKEGFLEERGQVRVMLIVNDRTVEIPLTFTSDQESINRTLAELESRKPRAYSDDARDVSREMGTIGGAIRDAHGLRDEERKRAALTTALARRDSVEANLPVIAQNEKKAIQELVSNLENLALGLGSVEGRKAILYVGNRISMSPGEALYTEAAQVMADYSILATQIAGIPEDSRQARLAGEVGRIRLTREVTDMIRETSAVGITFYTLTPPTHEDTNLTWRANFAPSGSAVNAGREATKAAACVMSNDTGGLCQVGGSEMTKLLEDTFADFEAYYSLAFTPDREPDGEFHPIEVLVERDDVSVRYRDGYLDRPPEDGVRDRLIAALTFGDEKDELGVSLTMGAQQAAAAEGLILIPFDVRLPAQQLALIPVPGGTKRSATARLLITTMDQLGRMSGVQEYPIRFEVPESRLTSNQPLVYSHKVHLSLAPGEQTLAIGVWDEVANIGSFLRREIHVGDS